MQSLSSRVVLTPPSACADAAGCFGAAVYLAAKMPAAFLAYTLPEGEPFFCVVARRLQDLAPRERSRNSMRITAGAHVACALQFRFACHRVR